MNSKASLLTAQMTAQLLGVSTDTLRTWRARGQGPRYVKLGRAVRYQLSALEEFAGCTFELGAIESKATA